VIELLESIAICLYSHHILNKRYDRDRHLECLRKTRHKQSRCRAVLCGDDADLADCASIATLSSYDRASY
jgi:hypothetical protein